MICKSRYKDLRKGSAFLYKGWIVRPYLPAWRDESEAKNFVERNFRNIFEPEHVLKDDHRSFVGKFNDVGKSYITKNFKLQHNRLGFRIASVLYPSLGEFAYHNAIALNNTGIKTPPPGLLMQRVKFASIRDSWIVYEFVEGEELPMPNQLDIVDFVKNMHHNGWVHRDTNKTNFLKTQEGLITIDPICARASRSSLAKALDVLHLNNDISGALEHYGRDELGIWLGVAEFYRMIMRHYRSLKLFIRKVSGRNAHSGMR